MQHQPARTSVALALALAAAMLPVSVAHAAPGAHGPNGEHLDAPGAAVNASGLARLPDGSVNVPKLAQRRMAIRTVLAPESEAAATVELPGRVVMDPNASGRVQAVHGGRIEPGPRGLPVAGQAIKRGDVLAYVRHHAEPYTLGTQQAQLAELRAQRQIAEQRVQRLEGLEGTVPRKDIEAAESEAQSLAERIAAVGAGLATREALVAPVPGVIASAHVVAGQVVDARELVFEIVDPVHLHVEAVAFDPGLASGIGRATLAVGNERVPLTFVGAARSLREQALPLTFRAQGKALGALAVGQPVRVFVQGKEQVKGIAVPVASLMKNPANQTIVWAKVGPERFEPRTVTVEPLDGVNVAVTSGLKAGDRVATQGATLINQVR